MREKKTVLHILPNLLGDIEEHGQVLPLSVDRVVGTLDYLIAESEKEGRRFLKRFAFAPPKSFRDVFLYVLNEHTTSKEKQELFHTLSSQGGVWGLVSDCGMPCLADPGEELILYAREKGIEVKALVGPSSFLLALVLSGLGGQRFTFRGYLPREENALIQECKEMERLSRKERSVHLFIEAPYRNEKLLTQLLGHLEKTSWLCVACDLTLPTEWVATKTVAQWKKSPLPPLDKRNTIFVLRGY